MLIVSHSFFFFHSTGSFVQSCCCYLFIFICFVVIFAPTQQTISQQVSFFWFVKSSMSCYYPSSLIKWKRNLVKKNRSVCRVQILVLVQVWMTQWLSVRSKTNTSTLYNAPRVNEKAVKEKVMRVITASGPPVIWFVDHVYSRAFVLHNNHEVL